MEKRNLCINAKSFSFRMAIKTVKTTTPHSNTSAMCGGMLNGKALYLIHIHILIHSQSLTPEHCSQEYFCSQWAKVISNKIRSRTKCTAVTITQCKRKSKLISHVESHLEIGASNWFALELRVEGPFILNKHNKHRTIAPFFLALCLIWFDLSWIEFCWLLCYRML